jgi:hypothetical protein
MGKSVKYTGGRAFEKGFGGQRRKFFKVIMQNGDGAIQIGGVNSFKFPVINGQNFSRSVGMNTEINVEAAGEYIVFTDLHAGYDYIFRITESLIDLSSTAGSFYHFSKPIVFGGNFEAEIDFISVSSGTLLGGTDDVLRFSLTPDGTIQVRVNGGTMTGTTLVNDGHLHTLRVVEVNGVTSVFIDGLLEMVSGSLQQITNTITKIGVRDNGLDFFDGIISNLRIKDLLNTDNSIEFKLNELIGEYELPVGNVFGVNLWSNPPTVVQSGWVDNGDASYTHTGGSSELRISAVLLPSTTYQFNITTSGSGSVNLQLGGPTVDGENQVTGVISGANTFSLTTNSTVAVNFIRVLSSSDVTVSNISVKEVTNTLNYENIPVDSRGTYELIEDNYLGEERVVNGDFDTDSDWDKSGIWTIENGKASMPSTGSFFPLRQSDVFVDGQVDLVQFNVSAITGSLKLMNISNSNNVATTTLIFSNLGAYSLDIVGDPNRPAIGFSRETTASASIDNISVKRKIGTTEQYVEPLRETYIKLSDTAGSFYKLGTNWVATGDYSIEQYVYYTGAFVRLHGNIDNFGSRAEITTAGAISWTVGSGGEVAVSTLGSLVPTNKLSSVRVERIGDVGRIFVNGTLVFKTLVVTSPASVNVNGKHKTFSNGGLLSKLNLIDLTTPANSLYFKLNEITQNYELPTNNVFGGELVTNGDFATNSDWFLQSATISNGVCSVASGVDRGLIRQSINTTVGSYIIKIKITNLSGSLNVQIRNSSNSVNTFNETIISNGEYELLAYQSDVTANLIFIQCANGESVSFDIDDVSIKSVTNALTYENIALDARDIYTLIDGAYLGSNKFVPSFIASTWTDNLDGSYTKNQDNFGGLGELTGGIVTRGLYLITYNMTNETGTLSIYTRNADGSFNIPHSLQEGINVEKIIDVINKDLWFDSNDSTSTTISNIRINETIEVSPQYLEPSNRALILLDDTAGSFYKLYADWVATDDYSIEQYVYFTGSFIALTGNVYNSTSRIGIYGHGGLFWRPEAGLTTVTTSTGLVPAHKLSLIKVERIGSVGKIYVNNFLVATETVPTGNVVVNANGSSGGAATGGILSDLKLTDLTDTSNSLEFELNQLTDNSELAFGNVNNSEKLINGDFNKNINNWITNTSQAVPSWDNGTLKVDAAGGAQGAYQNFATVVGKKYIASAHSINASTAHLIRVGDGPTPDAGIADSSQKDEPSQHLVSFVAISTTSYLYLRCTSLGIINWDNVSLRENTTDNYITYENIALDAREVYEKIDARLLGNNKVLNSNFVDNSVWDTDPLTSGTEWVISGGKASIDGTQTGNTDIFQPVGTNIGDEFLYSFKILSNTGPVTISRSANISISDTSFNSVGKHEVKITALAAAISVCLRCGAGTVAEVDNVTLRKIIQFPDNLIVFPVTEGMTLTEAWTVRGDSYTGLSSSSAASARVDAVISNTDDGILMEAGASYIGLILYVYDGVLYFQCGDGSAFGSASNRAEVSYTLPVGEFNYIIEWSANTSNAVLYVNGLAVGSQAFSKDEITGSDEGTVGQVRLQVAVNRGGWTAGNSGVYTNTITKCDIFNNQVTPDV